MLGQRGSRRSESEFRFLRKEGRVRGEKINEDRAKRDPSSVYLKRREGGPKGRLSGASLNFFCHVGSFWFICGDVTLSNIGFQIGRKLVWAS